MTVKYGPLTRQGSHTTVKKLKIMPSSGCSGSAKWTVPYYTTFHEEKELISMCNETLHNTRSKNIAGNMEQMYGDIAFVILLKHSSTN